MANRGPDDFNETDAFKHVSFVLIDQFSFQKILRGIQVFDYAGLLSREDLYQTSLDPDVSSWLSKLGQRSQTHYLRFLCYYSKSVRLSPAELLNLKLSEDPKHRYFPAEKLMETWIVKAKQDGQTSSTINNTLGAVRSFHLHSRAPLLKIVFVYRPQRKSPLQVDQILKLRGGFNFYGKVIYDFLLSVPLRSGQFTHCAACGEDYFPRWRNITTFPKIEPYSPFVIRPHKGHDSERYSQDLMQVCYLTQTVAAELNELRDLKETLLERPLQPDEYIFTYQINSKGAEHIAPVTREAIRVIFRTARKKTGVYINPQLFRTWVNVTLSSKGVDKLLRDLYLGHTCHYEMGYVMQLVNDWQRSFREKKALEALDIVAQSTNHVETNLPEPDLKLSNDEFEFFRSLFRRYKASGGQL